MKKLLRQQQQWHVGNCICILQILSQIQMLSGLTESFESDDDNAAAALMIMMMMTCATIVCILQIQMWKLLLLWKLLLQTWLGCSCRNQLHFMLRLPLTTFAAQACVSVRVRMGVYLITLARAHILLALSPHLGPVCLSAPQAVIVDSTDKTKNILAALFLPHFVLSILIICLWLRSFCLPLANCSANYLYLKVGTSSHPPHICHISNRIRATCVCSLQFLSCGSKFSTKEISGNIPRGNGSQQIGANFKMCVGFVSWLTDVTWHIVKGIYR